MLISLLPDELRGRRVSNISYDLKGLCDIWGNWRFYPFSGKTRLTVTQTSAQYVAKLNEWSFQYILDLKYKPVQGKDLDKTQSPGKAGTRDLHFVSFRAETGSLILIASTYNINTLQRQLTCCQI